MTLKENNHINTDKDLLAQVRNLFAKDRFAADNGAVIDDVGNHYAKCSMRLTDRHLNAMGAIMGGVAYTLADFTFAVASNWENPGIVSLNSTISYLGAVKGKQLIAEAFLVKEGRTTCYYRIEVKDELGDVVAEVVTTGYRTRSAK